MPRRLIVIGSGPTSERLAELARLLGYDELAVGSDAPADVDPGDHIVIAADDPREAGVILGELARRPVLPAYLGYAAPQADGWKALVRLAAEGVPKERLDAIAVPAGVDVGALTPEEVAIAIAAELVAVQRGRRRPSAGLPVVERSRRPHEARPRRLIGAFARPRAEPAGEGGGPEDGPDEGKN